MQEVSKVTEEEILKALDELSEFRSSPEGRTPAPTVVPPQFSRSFDGYEWTWEDEWKNIMYDKWRGSLVIPEEDIVFQYR